MSERFAQYIDQMIEASGTPSGSLDTLERLQQFLEPILFLAGLELANTFEYFYRYEHLRNMWVETSELWVHGLSGTRGSETSETGVTCWGQEL